MSKNVRYSMDELNKLDVSEQLQQLASQPDSEIDLSEVPETTEAWFAKALARRQDRWRQEASAQQKKAS